MPLDLSSLIPLKDSILSSLPFVLGATDTSGIQIDKKGIINALVLAIVTAMVTSYMTLEKMKVETSVRTEYTNRQFVSIDDNLRSFQSQFFGLDAKVNGLSREISVIQGKIK